METKSPVVSNRETKVALYLLPDTLTRGGAFFLIQTWGDTIVEYGDPYSLERYVHRDWCILKTKSDGGFHLLGYGLPPGEEVFVSVDWSVFWGELPNGKYRLVKDFSVRNTRWEQAYHVSFEEAAEFTLP